MIIAGVLDKDQMVWSFRAGINERNNANRRGRRARAGSKIQEGIFV